MSELHSTRRNILGLAGTGMLSATALTVLGGTSVRAATMASDATTEADVGILNVALGLEHEGIAAYQIGAESGLLQKPVLDAAVLFQGHHKGHRDALIAAIRSMGGTPVEAKSQAEYIDDLEAGSITDQAGVLKLAQRLERGAATAYLGVIPSLASPDLKAVAAKLAADESAHYGILTHVLGDGLQKEAFIYG